MQIKKQKSARPVGTRRVNPRPNLFIVIGAMWSYGLAEIKFFQQAQF